MVYSSKCPCHPEPLPIGNYRDEELEVVQGGMGDYNYMYHGCMEFTIEVTNDKLLTCWCGCLMFSNVL